MCLVIVDGIAVLADATLRWMITLGGPGLNGQFVCTLPLVVVGCVACFRYVLSSCSGWPSCGHRRVASSLLFPRVHRSRHAEARHGCGWHLLHVMSHVRSKCVCARC